MSIPLRDAAASKRFAPIASIEHSTLMRASPACLIGSVVEPWLHIRMAKAWPYAAAPAAAVNAANEMNYSALIPAVLMIGHHLSISAF